MINDQLVADVGLVFMETLRFLMVSTHYPPRHLGGDAVFVSYLAEELARRGHEVHVVSNPSVYRALRGSSIAASQAGVGPEISRHEYVPRLARTSTLLSLSFGSSRKSIERIRELAGSLHPDVVHWHNTKGFIGRPFAMPGSVSLYTAHDYYMVCPRSDLARPDRSYCTKPKACLLCTMRWRSPPQLWRAGSRRVIRPSPDFRILCPSEFIARRLGRDGISQCTVLRNFVPRPAGRSSGGDQRGHLVYLGVLEDHKGPGTLLEAFAKSKGEQGFRMHMIGEGSLKSHLQRRAKELGVDDRVEIPGFLPREEVESILAGASSLVVPSEWPENAPLSVLEALSFGVPVLGSDQGGLPEIISAANQRSFRSGDQVDLAESLRALWADSEGLEALRESALKAYESDFSPEVHMSRYLSLVRGASGR